MTKVSNIFLLFALMCTVLFIACNNNSDLDEMSNLAGTEIESDLPSARLAPIAIGECEVQVWNNGVHHCVPVRMCPPGTSCALDSTTTVGGIIYSCACE